MSDSETTIHRAEGSQRANTDQRRSSISQRILNQVEQAFMNHETPRTADNTGKYRFDMWNMVYHIWASLEDIGEKLTDTDERGDDFDRRMNGIDIEVERLNEDSVDFQERLGMVETGHAAIQKGTVEWNILKRLQEVEKFQADMNVRLIALQDMAHQLQEAARKRRRIVLEEL